MLYQLDPHPGVSFRITVAALGLSPADVADMLTGRLSAERGQFIAAVAKGASERLLHIQPQGSA